MKKTKRVFLIILFFSFLGNIYAQSNGIVPGVVRVKFKTTKSFSVDNLKIKKLKSGSMQTGLQSVDNLNQRFQVREFSRVFPYNAKNEARHRAHGLHLWYEIKYDSPDEYKAIVTAYSKVSEISISEPVLVKQAIPYEIKPAGSPLKSGTSNFNDPYLPNQWHFNNTGQTSGTPGADANIFSAWELTTGNPNVIVSIHDEGVDINHEDLKDNIWINQAEKNGIAGIDDDGNGYIDDINGFNFLTYKGIIDANSHGTHVAGTIAAVSNNGIGVAGVAGGSGNNDGVKIMPCQIIGNGNSNIANSYVYAADNGAVISQNSWGYQSSGVYEQSVLDAIDYFIEEAGNFAGSPMKGGVVIFASGNNNQDMQHYPGYYNKTIAVNAVGPTNVKASYSNFGSWTEISAPGGEYTYGVGAENGVLSTLPNGTYGYMTGTSMACPHVSGIAALAVSKYGGSTFTNEELKTRILTGYLNIDDLNPDYIGLLGVGVIDAGKVLDVDEQAAPEQISDLTVSAVSQDFMSIDWTVPIDTDDEYPLYFDIYYNTVQITQSNLSLAEKVRIKSEDAAGEQKTYRVENLLPLTEYYFAIIAIDRWGNASLLSNVVAATTNNGPDIDVSPTSLMATADVATDYIGTADFTISNLDEGVLKWNVEARHVNQILPWSNKNNNNSFITAVYNPTIGKEAAGSRTKSSVTPLGDMNYYGGYSYESYIIGETDTSITNSSATRYTPTAEEGFNLTNVEMLIKQDLSRGPFIVEVYSGDDINTANLLLSQEYNAETYYNLTSSIAYVTLTEQLYFAKGETFWIVFHAPSGNLYPLGVAAEVNEDDSENCFMSFNQGRSWMSLNEAIGDPRWVWQTKAVSSYDFLGKYITLSPSNGEVLTNQDTPVSVTVDGTELPNGTYTVNIVINTNDKDEPQVRIPLTLTVSGHKPEMVYEEIVEFGTVLYGKSKSMDVVIGNKGLGNFQQMFQSATLTGTGFTAGYISTYSSIQPSTEMAVTVTFTPSSVGTFNGALELIDANGEKVKMYFNGVGAEPPVAEVSPDTIWFNNVAIGDVLNGSFTVTNAGNYPLKYFIPAYDDGSKITDLPKYLHKFGYTSRYTINDPSGLDPDLPYVWNDISTTGTAVQQYLNTAKDDHYLVPLGFEMPFYRVAYDSVYITEKGVLTFDDNSTFNSSGSFNYIDNPNGYISAWWTYTDLVIGDGGGIYYKNEPGKLIVQYTKCGNYWAPDLYYADIQFHLYENGNIEIYYGESNLNPWEFPYLRINIEDPEHKDMYLVNDGNYPSEWAPYSKNIGLSSYSAIRIINPGRKLFSSVTNTSGTLAPGESSMIDYSIETANLYEGIFNENVSVVSNDPFNNPLVHTAVIDINAGGVANVSVNTDSIGFGEVFQNGAKSMKFEISNTGSASDAITNIYLVNGTGFTYSDVTSITLKAKTKNYFSIDINTGSLGVFADELVVENVSGVLFRIKLTGEVVEAPSIDVNVTSLSSTLNIGETEMHALTVSNSGANDLEFMVNANSWWYLHESATSGVVPFDNMTYTFKTSNQENGPIFRWNDIVDSGTKLNVFTFPTPETVVWKAVELPFTFNYYGIDYDTVYVGANGLVSFTPDQGETTFLSQINFPDTAGINNFIAPLHAFGSCTDYYDEKGGVYAKSFDDKVIIQWHEYMDNFGMGSPISVQLLLFADGSMKFQYNEIKGTVLDGNGIIGLENIDGTKGVQVSAYQYFITDKLAIAIAPAKKFVIAPSGSKDFDLIFDATEAMSGMNKDTLIFSSNDPLKPELKVSLDLLIKGTNTAVAYDSSPFTSIDLGTTMAYTKVNEFGMDELVSYTKEFTIRNTGDTLLNINGISISVGNELKLEYWYEDPWWGSFWSDATWLGGSHPAIYPESGSFTFKLSVTPTGDTLTDGTLILPEIKDTLVFSLSTPEGELRIPVNAIISLPPSMELANDTLAVLANTKSHVETKSFSISNNGLSALDYSLSINYKREGSFNYDNTFATGTKSNIPLKKGFLNGSVGFKSYKVDGYETTLEYDTQTSPSTNLGYGGELGFATATEFVAPEEGFVLSDVMTWYTPDQILNSTINYEIRAGETLNSSVSLQKGSFEHIISTPDPAGEFLTTHLSDSIAFKPLEKFWVIFIYPVNAIYPQGAANVTEPVDGRFMFGTGDGTWYDITSQGDLAQYGWMVKALEKTHYETGWASITSGTTGSVAIGKSINVDVKFDASFADEADNYAEVVISTNDPEKNTGKVYLYMHVNQAPVFENAPSDTLTVYENDTLIFSFETRDIEYNTVSCSTDNPMVAMTFTDNVGEITFTPDYESAGVHTISVEASDDLGNNNEMDFIINVMDANRLPIADTIADQQISLNIGFHSVNISSAFTDPDGDVVAITDVEIDGTIAQVSLMGSDIIIRPNEVGTSTVSLYGTDNRSESVVNNFSIEIVEETIEPNSNFVANTIFSPNGDGLNDTWVIENPELYDNCKIVILNSSGQEVFTSIGYDIPWDGTLDRKQLKFGTYYYVITLLDGSQITGVIGLVK